MRCASTIAILILAGAPALFVSPALAQGVDARRQAVQATLAQSADCRGLGDFYWEIGDAAGVLASGAHGRRISADGVIHIASASKWVFGAYVVQRLGGVLPPSTVDALEMKSGYDRLNPLSCARTRTVADCLAQGSNGELDAGHVGKFSYNGGHDQKLAVDLGLGAMDAQALNDDLRHVLGNWLAVRYASPQPAGGMVASPAAYGVFLRRILDGSLRIGALLGSHPVCTLPSGCTDATHSPAPYAWHYSLNHWIEDAPGEDGAFNSAGAFGFYPWISADRKTYGVLARESLARDAAMLSAHCGAAMRHAWANAAVPPATPLPQQAQTGRSDHPLLDAWRRRRAAPQ